MTEKAPITHRQKQVYDAICDYYRRKRIAPTYNDLRKILGLSHSTVHEHVQSLIKRGWVRQEYGVANSIFPVEDDGVLFDQAHIDAVSAALVSVGKFFVTARSIRISQAGGGGVGLQITALDASGATLGWLRWGKRNYTITTLQDDGGAAK